MKTPTTKAKLLKALAGPLLVTREDATALAAATAALIIERDKLQALRNEAVEQVSLPYAVEIDAFNAKIKANEKALLKWAIQHRKAQFGDAKSTSLAGHAIAFREGTGKVGTAEGITEEDVIDALVAAEDDSLAERFIAVKPALDKNAILTVLRAGGTLAEYLGGLGLVLVKEEKCEFKPDLDAAPAALAVDAA